MTRQTKKIFSWQIKNKNKNNVTNKKRFLILLIQVMEF